MWLSWLDAVPQSKELQVRSQSGHVPGLWVWSLVGVHARGNHLMSLTSMFLSLSLSPPFSFSKNKFIYIIYL